MTGSDGDGGRIVPATTPESTVAVADDGPGTGQHLDHDATGAIVDVAVDGSRQHAPPDIDDDTFHCRSLGRRRGIGDPGQW